MKKSIIIRVCAVLIVAIGITLWVVLPTSGELPVGVLARVNGVDITREQVENTLKFNEIQIEALYKVLLQSTGSEEKTEGMLKGSRKKFPVTESEVLTRSIQGEAVCQQMEKQGNLLSSQETMKAFDKEFALMKTDENQKSFYTVLQQVLASRKITLEEYEKLGKAQSYYFYNMLLAKQTFAKENNGDETPSQTLDVQFDEYLNKLVEKAKVEQIS